MWKAKNQMDQINFVSELDAENWKAIAQNRQRWKRLVHAANDLPGLFSQQKRK